MIATLAFGDPLPDQSRAVRRATFVRRSNLPPSATCLVANGVREALMHALASEFDVEVLDATIPGPAERRVLLASASVYRVRGRLADAFVSIRAHDARALVSRAFGERPAPADEALSAIERETLERIVFALVPHCKVLCGTIGPVAREVRERAIGDLVTYFEVRTVGEGPMAIGFGLTRDPDGPIGERIGLDDLAGVELPAIVELGAGPISIAAFSRLAPGATIVLDTPADACGTLRFGDVRFARGQCGASGARACIRFEENR